MNIEDFKPGDAVTYVPAHVHGDTSHKDCENGIVKSKNEKFVFVRYIKNGILQETAAATRPEDLIEGQHKF